MSSQNQLIAAIKTAGNNHKQINYVSVSDTPDIGASEPAHFPMLTIWPNGFRISNQATNKVIINKFVIAVSDRHQDSMDGAVEAISDTAQILIDLVATLEYIYRGSNVKWSVDDDAQPYYDNGGEIYAGHLLTIEAVQPYNRNFCDVPSNDFDFPNVILTNLMVIDEGFANTTYAGNLIIDGGIA